MEKYTTLVVFITSNIFHLKAIFHFIETLLSTFCVAAAAAAHLFIKTKRQICKLLLLFDFIALDYFVESWRLLDVLWLPLIVICNIFRLLIAMKVILVEQQGQLLQPPSETSSKVLRKPFTGWVVIDCFYRSLPKIHSSSFPIVVSLSTTLFWFKALGISWQ